MTRSIDDLIAELRSFEPTPDEAENVHRLNEIFDGFHLLADREEALPEIFFLLERFPTSVPPFRWRASSNGCPPTQSYWRPRWNGSRPSWRSGWPTGC